jgi:ParB family chromosome partitioning protein
MVETIQEGRLARVSLKNIVPGSNPREYFDDEEQQEIDRSVAQKGVMTPILLRDIGNDQYQLVAGERRFRAAMKAFGEDYQISASIFDMDDTEAHLAATVENVIRADMSPAEEAKAASRLLAAFAGDRDEVARRMGLKRPVLDKRLALMNASDLVLSALTRRKIHLGHAELLAAAPKASQDGVLTKLMALPQMPSVIEFKGMLASIARPLATACFDKNDCATCPNNSDIQQSMFTEAIAAGNCTNGECYTAKTEAELAIKKAGLTETFPRVEIVREGDNYTVIKLVVEGDRGVGVEQASACRGCANFGAAISAIPGKEGRVFENQCFDTACNTRMVARQLKATAAAAVAANPSATPGNGSAGKGEAKSAAKAAPAKSKAAASAVSASVVEFRKKVWRTALRTELESSPRKSIEMLIAICLAGSARNVSGADIDKGKVTGLTGDSVLKDIQALSAAEPGQVSQTVAGIATTALDALDNRLVTDALKAFGVDLSTTFEIDATYLALLTKSEIGAIAKEVGLETAFGSGFSKLMGGKKDDAIKGLLGVKGFNYHVVPGQLAYL